MNNQWQNSLRNRMEQHEEAAPGGLWESIDEQLSAGVIVPVAPTGRKQILKRISMAAAAAVAIVLLTVVLFTDRDDKPLTDFAEVTDTEVKKEINNIEISIAERTTRPAERTTRPAERTTRPAKRILQSAETKEDSEILAEKVGRSPGRETLPDLNQPNDQLFAISTIQEKSGQSIQKQSIQKQSGWQANLSANNLSSASTESFSGYKTFAVTETVDNQYDFVKTLSAPDVKTEVNHDQPVTFGITLRYNLNDKWSIASGLTYSLLKSQLYSGTASYHYNDDQTLHYLGVPLNVEYKIWQNNKISTYITAGGMMEKNISGRLSSNYYIDNELVSTTRESITDRHLQWSAGTAIGLEYRISDLFGIYIEPGVSYYFKNDSELKTIYKDRPANFNLRVGLRFSINH